VEPPANLRGSRAFVVQWKRFLLVSFSATVDNAATMEASVARRPARSGPKVPARLLRLASDERLVELVRAGSEPAFEAVFDRHHRGILAFCRHMLGSVEEAEDAVQHTFMAAYRDLLASGKPIQLRAWLYTIARNRCLSVLRARRERPITEIEEPATEHLSSEVQRRQDLRDMLRDIAELPDDQRAALVLAEAGDVSHEEIGEILEIPREKVKALVFQARSSLIASRKARDTPCEEIRVQLSELRGGALRRTSLRRHLKECAGCREFRSALGEQRRMLAAALPVIPTVALKHGVLASTLGGGTGAAAAAGGGAAAGGALAGSGLASTGGALAAKVLVVAAVAGGSVATGVEVSHRIADSSSPAPQVRTREAGSAAHTHGSVSGRPAPAALGGAAQSRARGDDPTPGASERSAGTRQDAAHRTIGSGEAKRGKNGGAAESAPGQQAKQDGAAPANELNGGNAAKPETAGRSGQGNTQEPANAPKPESRTVPVNKGKIAAPVATPVPAEEPTASGASDTESVTDAVPAPAGGAAHGKPGTAAQRGDS
jgi:RNA polymerase sigma factor (sigma-70 family)